ncbi:hypothetical protein HDV01_003415 [Terramyces sp. JEL0728]|nr:hypothetical protein HDV01_003415 [Terramyces sp. JEL0728]
MEKLITQFSTPMFQEDRAENELNLKNRKRQTQSCDRCKFKKRKCDGNTPCANCVRAEVQCTMLIEQKKRGPKRNSESGPDSTVKKSKLSHDNTTSDSEQLFPAFESAQPKQASQLFSYNPIVHSGLIPKFSHSIFEERPATTGGILDFDTDFAFNFGLDINNINNNLNNVDIPLENIKPSAYNPVTQPLTIDPEVLNLYTQLNPKLALQSDLDLFLQSTLSNNNIPQDDAFLYGAPTNLTIPELSNIPATFYMHLIAMFFTYYHPIVPVVQETAFLENLVPNNNHHPMLMNVIYAIGCHYSKSPFLYQVPFYTPQKATEYFINRALVSTPAPETWKSINTNTLAVTQATILLSSCDFISDKTHTWMMTGMAIRLSQNFEFFSDASGHDFLTVCNSISKFHVKCSVEERKRVWWSALLLDMFSSLSSGNPLTINEADYAETMITPQHLMKKPCTGLAKTTFNMIQNQADVFSTDSTVEPDKWMPFFSGFPKDTIFGASDMSSECFARPSVGFLQVNHLFSKLENTAHLIELSYITRRVIRFNSLRSLPEPRAIVPASLYSLLSTNNLDINRIHDTMILWYENLPSDLRLWGNLEVLVTGNEVEMNTLCTVKDGVRLSSIAVIINILYFATLSLLHQRNAESSELSTQPDQPPAVSKPHSFKTSSSMLSRGVYESPAILKMAYKAQVFLLKKIYGQFMPPAPTTIPPSEIVASPIIATLLMISSAALINQQEFAFKLIDHQTFNGVGEVRDSQVEPLESVILPVLDNTSQVWPVASKYASSLRQIVGGIRETLRVKAPVSNLWQQPQSAKEEIPEYPQFSKMPELPSSVPQFQMFPNNNQMQPTNLMTATPSVNQNNNPFQKDGIAPKDTERSFRDLRNEFEDEFLL